MKIVNKSHLDHGLSPEHLAFIREKFGGRSEFFIETVELPAELPSLKCGLHGPIMGEDPVPEDEVFYRKRGNGRGASRLCSRPPIETRKLTVIGGPGGDDLCVLYTAYGGPLAPREPEDTSLSNEKEREESVAFWNEHALSAD